jgi:Leucine-rich repeat (LRR) protein
MTHLKILWLWGNEINDITPLATLTDLTSLRLTDNPIGDISVLAELRQLEDLHLENCQIEDISALANHTNLQSLNLKSNPLNVEAYSVYLPMIQRNNPLNQGIRYDRCPYPMPDDLAGTQSRHVSRRE